MTVFGPRCLLEASKSLPRASQEPPKSRPRALHALEEPPMRPPKGFQEPAVQTFLPSFTELETRVPRSCQAQSGPGKQAE